MRLLVAVALGSLLIAPMRGPEIERAMALARGRDADRQQFHHRYLMDLPGPVVTQIEVITEFRRLVIIAEEHVFRGDWMFTRSLRSAEEALAPTRGVIALRAQARLSPLNALIEPPAYRFAVGNAADAPFEAIDTQVLPKYSVPFKKDGKTLSSLVGATLEASVAASRMGQNTRTIAVTLDSKEIARVTVDFAHLD